MPPGRKQRGGARDHLNGSGYTPDITSADEMMEKISFLYVSSHGATKLDTITIIPDDTFLIFTGSSGYYVYQTVKRSHERKGRMNMDLLLSDSFAAGDTPEAKLGNYKNALYTNFFEGDYKLFRMYPGMQIFCPGDIIQSNEMTFSADIISSTAGQRGVYSLPVSNEDAKRLYGSSPDPLNDLFMFLAKYHGVDPAVDAAYTAAEPKFPEFLTEIKAIPYDSVRYARIKEFVLSKGAPFVNAYQSYVFNRPEYFHIITSKYAFNKPNNELLNQGILASPITPTSLWVRYDLGTLLHELKPIAGKKYKFVIVGGCRAPLGIPLADVHPANAGVPFITHKTIAAAAEIPRITARRMSYVTKEIPEECALGKLPGLNLGRLRELYNQPELYTETMRLVPEYTAWLKSISPVAPDYKDPILDILQALRYMFFTTSPKPGIPILYNESTKTRYLATLLINLLKNSFYLKAFGAKYAATKEYCNAIVNELKEIFGKFILELREGSSQQNPQMKSIGRVLLESIGEADRPLNENERMIAVMGSAEKAVVAPFLKLRADVAEAERMKALERQFNSKNGFFVSGVLRNFKFFFIDSVKVVLDTIDANLQKNAWTNTTLEESLEKTRGHLNHLLNGRVGAPDSIYKRIFSDPAYLANYETEFDQFTAEFTELPKAAPIIAQIAPLREMHRKLRKEYDQLKQFLTARVGDLELTIQEEVEAAAAAPKPRKYNNVLAEVEAASKLLLKGKNRRGLTPAGAAAGAAAKGEEEEAPAAVGARKLGYWAKRRAAQKAKKAAKAGAAGAAGAAADVGGRRRTVRRRRHGTRKVFRKY